MAILQHHPLDVLSRGVEAIYSLEELKTKLSTGRPLRVKLGLDPTAPDIHLGHTVQLRKMRQFQDLGHKAILIIGDYTAKIGDPSGRDTTRPILDDKAIAANAQTYLDQAGKILDSSPGKLELRRNSEWLAKLTFADVLRLTGLVTVQQMLHRENFKLRMQSNTEIMVSEFMYPLMQGYDSIAIEADVELGGTDQTFNCLIAREMMGKVGLPRQVVVINPILVGLDGREKMSKSKGNYVGVLDKPDEMFGKIMSIPDELMPNYFQLLTDLPPERIASLLDQNTTHPRQAKDILGRVIVEELHNPDAANAASAEFRRRFSEGQLPTDMESRPVSSSPIGILKLICEVGFAPSNSEARRLVEQGGVSLGEQKITDPAAMVAITGDMVLKVGKRRVCKVTAAR
ncbi:MAG: tyrosine--tRNA ligase [Phycisphaeraceae bacterium]|nr:tyrosine--tRNA ligase [Phycisphaeraceae bacterium]